MASKRGSNGSDGIFGEDWLEIPTLGDVWPPSMDATEPVADTDSKAPQRAEVFSEFRLADELPQSMAPRSTHRESNARRRILNVIEPTHPLSRNASDAVGRAARYAQAQAERYADEPSPQRAPAQLPLTGVAPARGGRAPAVPGELQARYIRQGRDWYSPDGVLAFSVRNDRFTTPREDHDIVKDLVLAAERNGWTEVTVTGTDRWRRRAWREATLVGLQVKGYEPTPRERQQVIRDIARQSALLADAQAPRAPVNDERVRATADFAEPARPASEPAMANRTGGKRRNATERNTSARSPKRRLNTETMEGQLIKHGEAPYRFQNDQSPSYFTTILTPDGEQTYWGVGLKEAIEKSETQVAINDRVVLRRVGKTPVTVKLEERAADGRLQQVNIETERVEWRVERPEWFVNRAQKARLLRDDQLAARRAAREDPELARAMLSLRAGELLAEERLSDPKRREQFIGEIVKRLEREAERGRAAPDPRIRASARARSNAARDIDPRAHQQDFEQSR